MRTRVAHAPRSAQTDGTRRTGLSVKLQFNTYQTRNSVQTTGATADTLRFHALRLHEVGIIKSSPQKIISQGTDWRFLNELKKELKA